jgi:glutamine amidotransferase
MDLILKVIPMQEIRNQITLGKPLLGICVGMQVLGSKGIEFEEAEGLNIIPGIVSRINSHDLPLPHVGWNNLSNVLQNPLMSGITEEDDFYFVHSYGFGDEVAQELVIARASYGSSFPAVINKNNVYGVQFHPEKSQKAGEKIISNFLNLK